ncbi:hypothetical protein E1301_Tti009234 [Triplophysa tibetana]|uniref:Uncharacterized protein n=1 Tax=Triplophysa tibetana TaxID=1572043 RepID=A0A5A9NXC4_9TELE|nr:hypothetical protein E1301_Tti009234 [Triplophysa tibetana]
MTIQDDDNALSPINKRFLELENDITNLRKYSRTLERYQCNIPYEVSRAIKDLNPVSACRLRKSESERTAERLQQASRDLTRNLEELERVKVKRNLLLDKREKHKKSLKEINDRIRPAQEARKAVLKRIRDSGGVSGSLPTPPLGKRPVPPPIPKAGLGCSIRESTPVLDVPLPKQVRTSKGESLPPLQRPPRVGVPQQKEGSFQPSKRYYDNQSFLEKSEAEVQCLKMTIQDDDNALSPINKRFLELENDITNLRKYSRTLERYQCNIPYEVSRAIKDLNPVSACRLRKSESERTAERLQQASRDLTRNLEELERVKVKRNLLLDKREKHKKSLKEINDRIRPAQEARKAVLKRIRDSGGVSGSLPTPPLGKRPVPPPILKAGLGRRIRESTPVLDVPLPKQVRTSKGESLPPLQRPPRVGVPQQKEGSFQPSKRYYDNQSFLEKSEAEVQCLKMTIQDDDNALSPINKRFLELENDITNLRKYSRTLERYQCNIPYEVSRAIKDLNPVSACRLRKSESERTAERLQQASRDLTRNLEELERVKVKRNLLLDKREKHKKSLKEINDRIRPAQEARKAVLKRIRDSGVN